jgi:glycosyltransferase involved in cell wall biosynthesis
VRVLHVITGLENGGAEAALYRLASNGDGMQQVVSLTKPGVYGSRLAASGVPVATLDMPRGRLTVAGLVKLFRLIRTHDPDVVQTWMYHSDLIGGIVGRLAGKRAIVWGIRNSNLDPDKTSWKTRLLPPVCARLSAWIPRKIISCSHEAARLHASFGYKAEKIVIVANGYDVALLRPDAEVRESARGQLKVPPGVVLLGMVGRWDPQKDHPTLIAALAALAQRRSDNWRCVLVGPEMTITNAALMRLLNGQAVRSRIQLLGPRDDIPALMNAFDLHVLSSSYGEAFPNVVAEAMACATPCVVTNVGDAALIVGETGWVVPPNDPARLASALQEALVELGDASRWRARQKAARERIVANFTLDRMVRGYREVWREAIRTERD